MCLCGHDWALQCKHQERRVGPRVWGVGVNSGTCGPRVSHMCSLSRPCRPPVGLPHAQRVQGVGRQGVFRHTARCHTAAELPRLLTVCWPHAGCRSQRWWRTRVMRL